MVSTDISASTELGFNANLTSEHVVIEEGLRVEVQFCIFEELRRDFGPGHIILGCEARRGVADVDVSLNIL